MTILQTPKSKDFLSDVTTVKTSNLENVHQHSFSMFLIAIIVFLALNISLSCLQPFYFNPYSFNYHGWSWWIFNDLRLPVKKPNIVLLGSSTMVSAIAGCDANYLQKQLDLTAYHRCQFLEDHLSNVFIGRKFESFSLAGPGQMPSDAYLLLKAMFVASSAHPHVIIYGLAPRDFMDSTLTSPGDTEYFKYLSRLVNLDDVIHKVFHSPFAKLDWFLQNNIYLYKYSLDLCMQASHVSTGFIDFILPKPWSNHPFTWWDRQKVLPGYLPADIKDKSMIASPIDRNTASQSYQDNTADYLSRYKNPDNRTYKTQVFFLSKLAQFCQHEHINLILVNMPITLDNIRLMKPGAYFYYLQKLKEFSLLHKLAFYNLNSFSSYSKNDFHDGVHLNAFGGQKFFTDLVNSLVQDKQTKATINMSGELLANPNYLSTHQNNLITGDR